MNTAITKAIATAAIASSRVFTSIAVVVIVVVINTGVHKKRMKQLLTRKQQLQSATLTKRITLQKKMIRGPYNNNTLV